MDFTSTSTPFTEYLNTTDSMAPNSSFSDVVNATMTSDIRKGKTFGVVIKVVYAFGIIANATAIVALRRGERRMRNRKHLLLLTSLATNDLVALVGMMCAMLVADHVPGVNGTRLYCGARVLLRTFGIGSVCIAVTMALERYLALTRPFFYQKQVTYYVIRMALLASWFWAAVLTCAPVLGLGLYYDEAHHVCARYRNATSGADFGYAIFYVVLGTLLCVVLVYCNVAVVLTLYAIKGPHGAGAAPLVRRVSRTSCRQRPRPPHPPHPPLHHNAATAEEVAFSRLMAILSVFVMMCWLPQMLTTALFLALGPAYWPRFNSLGNISDVLMLLNYVLNPILYVLSRRHRPPATLCHSVASCFKRSHKRSTESVSMKTSCCAPETQLISDSSQGPEGRPLRATTNPSPTVIPAPSAVTLKIEH